MSTYIGKDGDTYSPTGLGYSLALVPAVAITDLFYKIYHITPPQHFPLENDWLILMLASFTNAFFAALLGVVLFLYLLELGLTKRQSLLISLIGLFTTNLFVYAKNSFAHMMFVTFLFLSFFLIKKYFLKHQKWHLILSGMTFGITSITYNQTFLLTIIPLGVYIFLLSSLELKLQFFKRLFLPQLKIIIPKYLFFLLGFLPFIIIYIWFENLRAIADKNLANPLEIAARGIVPLTYLPIGVFWEGLYGQIFSPGRSFFLYSPILLLVIFFWHKLKKIVLAEVVVFLLLSTIYILFFATQFSVGIPTQGITGLWHGESSWGPRYLLPLIPFGLLLVGFIFAKLNSKEKLVVIPLLLLGIYIEALDIVMPYQIKYHDLQDKFYVNSTEFTNFAYSNFIPRYSPIFMMSKNLGKLYHILPQTLDHGRYNVRFYDGIDFPFPVGLERWRAIEEKGYISFDNPASSRVKKISIQLINHPVDEASYSAIVQVSLNKNLLGEQELGLRERKTLDFNIPDKYLQTKNNQLTIDVGFKPLDNGPIKTDVSVYKDNPALYGNKTTQPKKFLSQILGLLSFSINDQMVNKESLDFPYVSPLGPKITGAVYQTYGGTNQDFWKTWEIHTQVYERVPDFWWFKFLYYWDVPKLSLFGLLGGLVLVCLYFGFKTFRLANK